MNKCFVCGSTNNLHLHHVYFGHSIRAVSDKHGFVCYLCHKHHNGSNEGVHFNRELDLMLKKCFQEEYERNHSREEFMRLIGRNYL